MDTALMVTRSVLQPAMSKRFIIQIMWQNVWRSVLLWVQLQRTCRTETDFRSGRYHHPAWEEEPDVTVSVVQPVLPKHTTQSPQLSAVQRYRKVIRRPSVRSRDCSAEKKWLISSKNVMTLVQAVYPLRLVSLQTDLRVQLDKVPKKYAGLDGTEIAISESQERMAVVVCTGRCKDILRLCR